MRLCVASSFPIHPPRGGGQERIAGLYRALGALGVEVEVVSLVPRHERPRRVRLGPGTSELRVPMSPAFERADHRMRRRTAIPSTDLTLVVDHELVPDFGRTVREAAARADVVVASHPYTLDVVLTTDRPLVYEAHNVEADLKRGMLAQATEAEALTALVEDVERRAVDAATAVMVCSAEDRARLGELYGLDTSRTFMVPNGADPAAIPYTAPAVRAELQRRVGLAGGPAVFVGSWHEPNLAAVQAVLDAAPDAPEVRWLILGSAASAFARIEPPANVDLVGPVDARFLASALRVADAGLNPMRFGSGTNLKMLTYALAGVPIVSSPTGARGLGFVAGRHHLEAEPERLGDAIASLAAEPATERAARVEAARDHVLEHLSWPRIAARAAEDLRAAT